MPPRTIAEVVDTFDAEHRHALAAEMVEVARSLVEIDKGLVSADDGAQVDKHDIVQSINAVIGQVEQTPPTFEQVQVETIHKRLTELVEITDSRAIAEIRSLVADLMPTDHDLKDIAGQLRSICNDVEALGWMPEVDLPADRIEHIVEHAIELRIYHEGALWPTNPDLY
jgi:hypothetical protein